MNVFELGFVAAPVIGALVGVWRHATLGVNAVLGGLVGAVAGVVAYFGLIFCLAGVMSLATGKPMFRPKKERAKDA